jgi:hypothetical protein
MRRVSCAAITGLTLLAIAVSGCRGSVSVGRKSDVAKSTVEKEISDRLTEKVGQRPKAVSCPGDLKAAEGTTMRCQLQADDGSTFGVTVTVTSIEGTTAKFDIKVDDSPSTSS